MALLVLVEEGSASGANKFPRSTLRFALALNFLAPPSQRSPRRVNALGTAIEALGHVEIVTFARPGSTFPPVGSNLSTQNIFTHRHNAYARKLLYRIAIMNDGVANNRCRKKTRLV